MSNARDPFVEFAAGATVFREGDAGDDMFIIEAGQIDITRKGRPDEAMATLGPGDFFGEMAMLEDQSRFATAVAKSAARVLRIERAEFTDMLKQNVEIAVRIMRKLAARQRRAEQRVQDLTAELARLKGAAAAPPREAKPAAPAEAKPRPQPAAAPAPAPPPAPPPPPPPQDLALRHVGSGQVLLLDPARSELLVGRPDPVTGIQPEINLGPFDTTRTLSRRHAKILREGGLYSVREEVGTTNGTFVNGERITSTRLDEGDEITIGRTHAVFRPGKR